jgi:hypothetical protein
MTSHSKFAADPVARHIAFDVAFAVPRLPAVKVPNERLKS